MAWTRIAFGKPASSETVARGSIEIVSNEFDFAHDEDADSDVLDIDLGVYQKCAERQKSTFPLVVLMRSRKVLQRLSGAYISGDVCKVIHELQGDDEVSR